jgi:ADP-heptose:LPS heptosyltransferase
MVRLGAVGDLVRTLPALHLLRQSWPETRIAWVVEEHLAPLLAGHPQIDAVFTIDRHGFLEEARRWSPKALGRIARLRGELRAFEPELAIDFQGCLKSGLASWLSGARVRLCFEREEVRERSHLFSNVRVPLPDRDRHRVRRALALARASGAGSASDEAAEDIPRVDLAFRVAERRRGRELQDRFGGVGRTVAIAPFTSRRQHWKRYPADRWRKVASDLAARDYSVLLIAGPGEEQEAHQLARDCGPGVGVCEGLELRWQWFTQRWPIEPTIRFRKQHLAWTLPRLQTAEACDRWTRLVDLANWQLFLARNLVHDQPLPWQKTQTALTPARVQRALPVLFGQFDSPAHSPKTRRNSPGWPKGRPRTRPVRYKPVKRGQSRASPS